jgi:predicted phage terminase large subunit-like protein
MKRSSEIGIDKEIAKRGLREFVEIAWPLVEPSRPYIRNWHTDAICDHLQACAKRQIKRLVVTVPPGSMKSLSCCVFFPSWTWTQAPEQKFIYASYNDKLSRRDSLRTRRLIESDWYRDRWGDQFELHQDRKGAEVYSNDAGGFRMMTTIKGGVTGEHADIQVVDDPIKPLDVSKSLAVADTALKEVDAWWNETMASRLVDFENSVRIIVMQRLVEGDLAGRAIEEGYEHLMLPMEFEIKRKCYTSIGFEDPRTDEGELLSPSRFSRDAVDQLKREMGTRGASAQLQQNPVPAGGNIIKEHWIRYYDRVPTRFSSLIQSWDCSFDDGEDASFVVGSVWGVIKGNYYLVDQIRAQLNFPDTLKAIKSMTTKHPKSRQKLVEKKANGAAVIATLEKEISGLIPINPDGSKVARVHAIEHLWEAGNVWLPSPALASWVSCPGGFVEEVTGFPGRRHDDQVDAMSQALVFLEKKSIGKLAEAMRNLKR